MLKKTVKKNDFPPVISFKDCPAKTFQKKNGEISQGRSVLNHCEIVGEVARALITRIPPKIQETLFPKDSIMAAAAHDIGKVSPCFVEKIRRACAPHLTNINVLVNIDPSLEKNWGGHAGVSQVSANAVGAPKYIPEILGQHHGFSPPVSGLRANDDIFGGPAWQKEREALVDELKNRLNADWPYVSSVAQARLLAGLASVSDWIGSGEFFEDPAAPWEENIERAISTAGFLPISLKKALNFGEVFSFNARAAQQQLINQVNGPGVYVLEAPMGVGKTEAALFAAYQLLEKGEATGIYFALPTQLTSNKIFERFSDFLNVVLASDCQHRSLLLHGNAWLLDTDMGEEGRPGGAWFNSAKRGLLAPFAVGTVDQALMAAMNVKHGFVRAFGLAGKVVILDEVHTYDAYTGTILDALVSLLRELKCTVIILTATLNHERREKLLNIQLASTAYPLITALPDKGIVCESPVIIEIEQKVLVRLLREDNYAVEEALNRAEQGQQILWIENTVLEAQERYLDLAARAADIGVACGLLHSRFTLEDRLALEDEWVTLFGKSGANRRAEQGRILVGTQVLEQSLDIDADFIVSRFAPTDMILQRIGRLWRHKETARCRSAQCEAWLLAPTIENALSSPENAFGRSTFIYSKYVLCRSLEVWESINSLHLPSDIRGLIENTYRSRQEKDCLAAMLSELDNGSRWRKGRLAMQQLARLTLADVGNTMPENKAQTRHSEVDSIDVLLLKDIKLNQVKNITQITLLNGEQCNLPWNRQQLDRAKWRELTAILMRHVVAVRPEDSPKAISVDYLRRLHLQHCFYLGHPDWPQDESILRVAIVDGSGELHGLQGAVAHDSKNLNYRNDLGYRVTKI